MGMPEAEKARGPHHKFEKSYLIDLTKDFPGTWQSRHENPDSSIGHLNVKGVPFVYNKWYNIENTDVMPGMPKELDEFVGYPDFNNIEAFEAKATAWTRTSIKYFNEMNPEYAVDLDEIGNDFGKAIDTLQVIRRLHIEKFERNKPPPLRFSVR